MLLISDIEKVDRGPVRKKVMPTNKTIFLEFDPPTNFFIPLSRTVNEGVWARETILDFDHVTNRFIPLIAIQEPVGMSRDSEKPISGDVIARLDKIENLLEQLQRTLDGALNEIKVHGSRIIALEIKFDEKNEEAGKLLKRHAEITKIINETTPFEKEIIKLKMHSDEWSLFKGSASRHKKDKDKEFYKFPFLFCPKCSNPSIEEHGNKITLTYVIPNSHDEYNCHVKFPDPNSIFEEVRNQYRLDHFTIPKELWAVCIKKEHDVWHHDYMRQTKDYLGDKEEKFIVKEKVERVVKNKPLRTDTFDNWFADIKSTLPKKGKPNLYLFRRYAYLFYSNRGTPFSYDDLKEKIKNKDGKKIVYNTITKHLDFLEKAGSIEHNIQNNSWQFKFETELK